MVGIWRQGLLIVLIALLLAGCGTVRPKLTPYASQVVIGKKIPMKVALVVPSATRDLTTLSDVPSPCIGTASFAPVGYGTFFEQTMKGILSQVYEQVDLVSSSSDNSKYHAVLEASLTKVSYKGACGVSPEQYEMAEGSLRALDVHGTEIWRSTTISRKKPSVAVNDLILNTDAVFGSEIGSTIGLLVSDWVKELAMLPIKQWAKGGTPVSDGEEERIAKTRDSQEEERVIESDVDRPSATKKTAKKNAYAVVVGIEKYREKLPKADFAARDAKVMANYLTKVLGYPEENVVVRINDLATRNDMEKYFGQWLKNNVEPGGSVFIYYSGHGAPNPKTGDAYLVPYDGDPTYVDTTAFPLKRLYETLDKLPAKEIVVVLDSCFSGAGGRSVLAKGAKPMGLSVEQSVTAAVGKAIVLTASGGDQISSAYEEKGHGLMTYFFLKGLQGDADANEDGTLTMAELYNYVKPQVEKVARKQFNNEQTPQFVANPEQLKRGGVTLIEKVSK